MNFGNFIKSMREKKGLKMREVERRSGISQAYISQIENGKRSVPKPEIIKKLAKGLDEDYSYLMYQAGYINGNIAGELTEQQQKVLKMLTKNHIDKLDSAKRQIKDILIEIPVNMEYKDVNGEMRCRATSPDDVFNLYYLLQMNINLHYKDKLLTEQDKEKIIKMLDAVFE